MLGTELRSSCIHDKYFTNKAISPVQSQYSERKKEVLLIADKMVFPAFWEAVMGLSCDLGECGCSSLPGHWPWLSLFWSALIGAQGPAIGTRKHTPES